MEKLHFDTDYMRGCHPEVMRRLIETNMEQTAGYGNDPYTAHACELIREACGVPEAKVFLMVGGTQTNATVIDGVLGHHEGVVCAETGHINVHEAGAVEASGHKVLTLPSHDGKILPSELEEYFSSFYADDTYEHMVYPGMVYISYPTEFGTLYSLPELKEIKEICRKYNAPLFLDGARLGYGLAAEPGVTLKEIASICDVFYIGGTKVGALFGEAVVIPQGKLISHVTTLVKQHGALLAKGRLLGVQFETLMTDGLYQRISRQAIDTAMALKKGFISKGYRPFIDSPTNQQFFELPNDLIRKLQEKCTFELWGPPGKDTSKVRFVTDWATSHQDVSMLLSLL
ncbi:MAG: low specificity L-threonine aldolase [Muribaculaceae bacterium]|nr:low specificity L-threonine aldolase [Muribaculaceae bacterium]